MIGFGVGGVRRRREHVGATIQRKKNRSQPAQAPAAKKPLVSETIAPELHTLSSDVVKGECHF